MSEELDHLQHRPALVSMCTVSPRVLSGSSPLVANERPHSFASLKIDRETRARCTMSLSGRAQLLARQSSPGHGLSSIRLLAWPGRRSDERMCACAMWCSHTPNLLAQIRSPSSLHTRRKGQFDVGEHPKPSPHDGAGASCREACTVRNHAGCTGFIAPFLQNYSSPTFCKVKTSAGTLTMALT